MPFDFTFFAPTGAPAADASAHQIKPTADYTADALSDIQDFILSAAKASHKGGAGYIIAGSCTGTRAARNTGPAGFALLDYDDAEPDWPALDQYEGFGWTTHNHMQDGKPHWRFVIPFVEPVLHGKLPDPFPGAHLRNRAQPAFLPTHGTDVGQIEWRTLGGSRRLTATAEAIQVATSKVEGTLLYAMFKRAGWLRGEGPNGGVWVRCPWAHEHTNQDESGTGILPDDNGLGHFTCRHGHCANRHSGEAFSVLEALPCNAGVSTRPKAPSAEPTKSDGVRPGSAPGTLIIVGAAELAKPLGPVPWLVKDLGIAPGRPTIISARSGTGKTYALQDLALAVASGQSFFCGPVRQGPVLHVDLDQGQYATRGRYQALSAGRKLNLADVPLGVSFFDLTLTKGVQVNEAEAAKLGRACEGHALCIIDSLRRLIPGLDESSSEFAGPLAWLTDISSQTGCTFIVVHHEGWTSGRTRGTTAIQDSAGCMWTLSREGDGPMTWAHTKVSEVGLGKLSDYYTTLWTPAGADPHNPHEARIEIDTSAMPAPQRSAIERAKERAERKRLEADAKQHQEQGRIGECRAQIMELLRKHPEGMSGNQIKVWLEHPKNTVDRALAALVRSTPPQAVLVDRGKGTRWFPVGGGRLP